MSASSRRSHRAFGDMPRRPQLVRSGLRARDGGNISVRLADGFLITPTDACLGSLDPDRLARLDADGRQIAGDRASKTITLHRRIYAATAASGRPAGSVIHTHSTSLVACSLQAFEANGAWMQKRSCCRRSRRTS